MIRVLAINKVVNISSKETLYYTILYGGQPRTISNTNLKRSVEKGLMEVINLRLTSNNKLVPRLKNDFPIEIKYTVWG